MVEADLGDESYGASGAGDDDNGDFGAEGEFEGFDQYGEGTEFDDSMGAAGGSGAAAHGKGRQLIFVLQLNALSFYVTKTVLVGPKWFFSDQIYLDLTIMIWSRPK